MSVVGRGVGLALAESERVAAAAADSPFCWRRRPRPATRAVREELCIGSERSSEILLTRSPATKTETRPGGQETGRPSSPVTGSAESGSPLRSCRYHARQSNLSPGRVRPLGRSSPRPRTLPPSSPGNSRPPRSRTFPHTSESRTCRPVEPAELFNFPYISFPASSICRQEFGKGDACHNDEMTTSVESCLC